MKGKKTGGRRPGSPNKATVEFRQTVQALLDDNRENVSEWLARVSAEDAYKALSIIANLAEFASPKLARTELAGDQDAPIQQHWTVEMVRPK